MFSCLQRPPVLTGSLLSVKFRKIFVGPHRSPWLLLGTWIRWSAGAAGPEFFFMCLEYVRVSWINGGFFFIYWLVHPLPSWIQLSISGTWCIIRSTLWSLHLRSWTFYLGVEGSFWWTLCSGVNFLSVCCGQEEAERQTSQTSSGSVCLPSVTIFFHGDPLLSLRATAPLHTR